MKDTQHRQKRRPYEKPAMIQVPLRPEEAVLGSCKTTGTILGGPGNSDCHNPVQCFTEGS